MKVYNSIWRYMKVYVGMWGAPGAPAALCAPSASAAGELIPSELYHLGGMGITIGSAHFVFCSQTGLGLYKASYRPMTCVC